MTTAIPMPGSGCQPATSSTVSISAGKFNGPVQTFGPLGSIKATASGTGTINSKGNIVFSGKGTITGGTGPFKHATGSFTFTGTQQGGDPDNPAHQHIVGNVKY